MSLQEAAVLDKSNKPTVPDAITATMIGDDLTFANQYAGWTRYAPQSDGTVLAHLFGVRGEVVKSYVIELIITEKP